MHIPITVGVAIGQSIPKHVKAMYTVPDCIASDEGTHTMYKHGWANLTTENIITQVTYEHD